MIVTSKLPSTPTSPTVVTSSSGTSQSPQKFRTIAQIATTNTVTVPKRECGFEDLIFEVGTVETGKDPREGELEKFPSKKGADVVRG